jgi:hypothetical protein
MSDIAPYAAPQPPERSNRPGCVLGLLGSVVLLTLVSVGACVFLVASMDGGGSGDGSSEAADVAEPECLVDDEGHVQAVMQVTNPTSERSNYVIRVSFEDGDGDEIDVETLTVDDLEPGQQAVARAVTDTSPPADGVFTCGVSDVERFSDE